MSGWSHDWDCLQSHDIKMEDLDLLQAFDLPDSVQCEAPAPDLRQEAVGFSDATTRTMQGQDAGFCLDFLDCGSKDLLESDIVMRQNQEEMGEDSFLPSLTDNDWFINSIFGEGSELVYNDKNLGETASSSAAAASSSSSTQPPCIKSEHSYSSNNLSPASSPLGLATVKEESDMATMFHGQSSTSAMDTTPSSQLVHHPAAEPQTTVIKCESPGPSSDPLLSAMITSEIGTSAFTPTPTPTPTIILATTTTASSSAVPGYGGQAVFPTTTATVHIKTDPADAFDTLQEQTVNVDSMVLPPTPPSSNGSDSDGSQSPQRSAPSSPQRQSPMPQSGVLILTEEEKRTLISEGYPIPGKLPLTKQEEKNLKKVRRKIKNKISAQESRRKKKEYVEQLEKRVEAYNHENCDLKKKVDTLQSDNRSLLGQLHKLQAMLTKGTKTAAASATQTGTVLMVLVLCFAVFLGGSGLGPSSLNVGYHRAAGVSKPSFMFTQQQPGPLKVQPNMRPGAPRAAPDTADDYTTPNLKSRVLMAFSREDPDDWCDEYRPLVPWDREDLCPTDNSPADDNDNGHHGPADPGVDDIMPVVSQTPVKGDGNQQSVAVVTIAMGIENDTAQEARDDYQAMMHPDIAVAPTLGRGNFTADLETA